MRKWRWEEFKFLRKNFGKYKDLSPLCVHLKRSKKEIVDKAREFKLWSYYEISLLKKYHPLGDKDLILRKIKRPWSSVTKQASTLGIQRDVDRLRWKQKEISLFVESYPFKTKKEIIKLFPNRSWSTLINKAMDLNLKSPSSWSDGEDSILLKKYRRACKKDLLLLLPKRTWSSIVQRALFLKLKRDTSIVMSDIYKTKSKNNTLGKSSSKGEMLFFEFLKNLVDKKVKHHNETLFGVIDFYIPRLDLYIQYDGDFTHGKNYKISKLKNMKLAKNCRLSGVLRTMLKDKIQNKNIKNLKRVWETSFLKALKEDRITDLFKSMGLL